MAIQQNMVLDHANLQQGSPGLTMQGHNGQADRYLIPPAVYRQILAQDAKLTVNGVGQAFGQGRIFVEKSIRSEEHTSELQSLMRISYAVFCLKKKKKQI